MPTDRPATPPGPAAERFLRLSAAYRPHLAADLVVLFALSLPYRLSPHLGLRLDAPQQFRAACHAATRAVGDARFGANVRGWLYDHDGVVQAFARQALPSVAPADAARFCAWLEDGYCQHLDPFFARIAWHKALRWILLKPDAVRVLEPKTYDRARAFAQGLQEALDDPAHAAAADRVQTEPGDELDALLQTKFHLVFLDDDMEDEEDPMVHSPLVWVEDIREGNLLRRHLAPLRGDGAAVAALEALLRAFLDRGPAGPRLAALAAERFEALRVAALFDWSRDAAA